MDRAVEREGRGSGWSSALLRLFQAYQAADTGSVDVDTLNERILVRVLHVGQIQLARTAYAALLTPTKDSG